MVNIPQQEQEQRVCPMSEIASQAKNVKRKCHKAFGKPSIELINDLGGVYGGYFLGFIEEMRDVDFYESIEKPFGVREFLLVEHGDLEDADIMMSATRTFEMSNLSGALYQKFSECYKEQSTDRFDFYGLSIVFFKAFDSILLTGIQSASSLEEWNTYRQPMMLALVHLAQIPTNIQTGLAKTKNELEIENNDELTYLGNNTLDTFSGAESQLPDLNNWLQENRGGYGKCPALEDKTLVESFDILFDIYGKAFFGEE